MSSVPGRQTAELLSELVDGAQLWDEVEPGTELGQRSSSRFMVFLPVYVRTPSESGIGEAHGYQLIDISPSGLGFTSDHPFEPGYSVLVELCANNTHWNGRMQVVHCTETVSGYQVGCKVVDSPPSQNSLPSDDDYPARQRGSTSLQDLRDEVYRAMRAYCLARRTWGLLGASVKKNVRKVIAGLPPLPTEAPRDCRRKHQRLRMEGDVHLVLGLDSGWRRMRPRIVDASRDGVGLLFPLDRVDDQVEQELVGEFKIRAGIPALVGFGAGPNTLWVPVRIVNCVVNNDCMLRVGAEFNAEAALDAFRAA